MRVQGEIDRMGRSPGRRRHVRLPIGIPVVARVPWSGGDPLPGQVENLSAGGMLIRLRTALPPGTLAEFRLQTRRGPLSVAGRVIWTTVHAEGVSHGVRFAEEQVLDTVTLFFEELRR